MQTEVLKEFLAVAKYSSFRKAADEVHLTHPALSKHIAALERELGFKLFDRSGATRLTPAGENFYLCVQKVLGELQDGIEKSREIAGSAEPARIQLLGAEDSAIYRFLPFVKTPYQIVPMSSEQGVLTMLKSEMVDVVVTSNVPWLFETDMDLQRGTYRYFPVGQAELSFVASSTGRFAGRESLYVEDLQDIEILEPFGNIYGWFEPVSERRYGKSVKINFVQDPSMPMGTDRIPLCDIGDRVIIAYRGAAHHSCRKRLDLVVIDQLEGESYEAEESLIWREGNSNPNVSAFVEEVRALAEAEREDAGQADEDQAGEPQADKDEPEEA